MFHPRTTVPAITAATTKYTTKKKYLKNARKKHNVGELFFRKKDMKKFFSSPFRPGQKHRKRVNSATQKRKDEQQ